MLPKVDIIIVNWNSGNLLSECIYSINNAVQNSFILNNVVVVDNASNDNSLDNLENIKLPLKIIRNAQNLGFAKACNQGAEKSNANYLLFLNPDTRLFENSLHVPVTFMHKSENEMLGIVGVKIVDKKNNVSRNCARFPTPFRLIYMSLGFDKLFHNIFQGHFMTEWDHLDSRTVDQVMGSFLLISRDLFKKLNGYDERFFVYYEDTDLSLRAKMIGFNSYYLSTASIYHKGGGTTEKVKAKRLAYILHSKLLFCKKHFSLRAYCSIFIITIIFEPISRVINCIIKGTPSEIREILKGYRLLIKRLIT